MVSIVLIISVDVILWAQVIAVPCTDMYIWFIFEGKLVPSLKASMCESGNSLEGLLPLNLSYIPTVLISEGKTALSHDQVSKDFQEC